MKLSIDDILKLILSGSILIAFNVIVFSVIKNPDLSHNPLLNHIMGIIEGALFVKYNFFGVHQKVQKKRMILSKGIK